MSSRHRGRRTSSVWGPRNVPGPLVRGHQLGLGVAMTALIAPLSHRLVRGQDTSCARRTDTGLHRSVATTRPVTGRRSAGWRARRGRPRVRTHTGPGRGRTGLLMPGSGPPTTVEGKPVAPKPALGTPAPTCDAGWTASSSPLFEAESQQPVQLFLDVHDRMGGVQLLLQPSHFRLELVHLRAEGVALGGLPTAFARGQALKRPLTPRPAPFRQMGAVQTLAAKQPAHLAGLRGSLSPIRLDMRLAPLKLGQTPGPALAARGSLRPRGPRRPPGQGASISAMLIDSSLRPLVSPPP